MQGLLQSLIVLLDGYFNEELSYKNVHLRNDKSMSKIKGAIVINTDRCKGCSLCVESCPQDVITISKKRVNTSGYAYAEPVFLDKCVGCAACGMVCPDGCITVYRMKKEE